MQIIGGKFRSKKLEWVSDAVTRPTTSRVKENIFNILTSMGANIRGEVLCLFSGSGQMGVECISRGAVRVVFNDIDKKAVSVIKRNCNSIGAVGSEIYNLDYMRCMERLEGRRFDIVFLDPPFADLEAAPNAAGFLRENDMLAKDAVIVAETENDGLVFDGFDVRMKKYGRAVIYFLQKYKG